MGAQGYSTVMVANQDKVLCASIDYVLSFPVLFAAIMGRLMYQMSRWMLERGATMGTLEQLS